MEGAYNNLFADSSGKSGIDVVNDDDRYLGKNRFPSRKRPQIPPPIIQEEYDIYALCESEKETLDSEDSDDAELISHFDSLSTFVSDIVQSICENRNSSIEFGQELSTKPTNPDESDLILMSELLADLQQIHSESSDSSMKMESLLFKDAEELFPMGLPDNIHDMCHNIREEISATLFFLDALISHTEDTIYADRGVICRLDGIACDWNPIDNMTVSIAHDYAMPFEAQKFQLYMQSKSLPVCNAVLDFLCNVKGHNYTLVIQNWHFAQNEFNEIFKFLTQRKRRKANEEKAVDNQNSLDHFIDKSEYDHTSNDSVNNEYDGLCVSDFVKRLFIDQCELSDEEVSTISHHLPDFEALDTLSLRHNHITTAGLTAISTVIWEYGLPLVNLKFDNNNIGSGGALMLSKAMHRCRHIQYLSMSYNPIGDEGLYYLVRASMNPHRKAKQNLPRPALLEEEENEDDYDSDAEDSDEEDVGYTIGQYPDDTKSTKSDDSSDEEYDSDDDAFTADGDNESVYSEKAEYIPSSHYLKANQMVAVKDIFTKYLGQRGHKQKTKNKLQKIYNRIRLKVQAVAAFMKIRVRGSSLYSLSVAGCDLTPYSLKVLSYALTDNHNLCSLDVSHNSIAPVKYEEAESVQMMDLVSRTKLTSLQINDIGMNEDGLACIVRAINKSKTHLTTLEMSDNKLGPTGANLISALPHYFVDSMSISLGHHVPAHMVNTRKKKDSSSVNDSPNSKRKEKTISDMRKALLEARLREDALLLQSIGYAEGDEDEDEDGSVSVTPSEAMMADEQSEQAMLKMKRLSVNEGGVSESKAV